MLVYFIMVGFLFMTLLSILLIHKNMDSDVKKTKETEPEDSEKSEKVYI